MPNEKNHLYTKEDAAKDRKNAEKRKTQQQFSRFSNSEATSINNAVLIATSPALQVTTKPQIGFPYDDSKGIVSTNQVIDFTTFGSQYTFFTVTDDVVFTFTGLPTGRNIRFVVDILVDNPAGVNLTFPQVTDPPSLSGNDGDRYVLTFVGVKRSDQLGQNPPVETYTFISGVTTTSSGEPIGNAVQGHIVKEVDDTVTNSNALIPDTELRFTLEPNKVYFLELNANFESDDTADIKFGLDIPAGASYKVVDTDFQSSPWTPFTSISNGQSISFNGGVVIRQSNNYFMVEAGPTGGTVTVTFAQATAQGTDTKLLRGTLLRIFQGGVGGLPSGSTPPPLPPPPPPLELLPLKGYAIGRASEGSAGQNTLRSMGGPATGLAFGLPAMGPGKMKNIRTTIVSYPNNGGGLRVTTFVNGITFNLGNNMVGNPAFPTTHVRWGQDRPFVKDDLIGWSLSRNSGLGLLTYNTWCELEYEKTELWFYTTQLSTVKQVGRFTSIFTASVVDNQSGPASPIPAAHQTSLGRDGLIKDLVYMGTIIAGVGNATVGIQVNGMEVFTSPPMAVGGVGIRRFDNVNVLVNANDLVTLRFTGTDPPPGPGATGIFGVRVVLI